MRYSDEVPLFLPHFESSKIEIHVISVDDPKCGEGGGGIIVAIHRGPCSTPGQREHPIQAAAATVHGPVAVKDAPYGRPYKGL